MIVCLFGRHCSSVGERPALSRFFFFPIVNRLEALTLWVVAICTGSFARGTDDNAELENEYAGRLLQKIFTFAHLGAFESNDQLFAGNELKREQ